jgi:predicted acylesterase/phospholipase RssA
MSTNFSEFLDAPWSKAWALWHDFGIYRGRKLYEWVYVLLQKKNVKAFGDTQRELVVIASNLTNKEILAFDKAKYANVSVAEAVRMSSGIPLFFSAHRWGNSLVVDGGLLSNYPFWAFASSKLPTFGFKLSWSPGKDAFAYCDKAYDGMTDASATQMVKLFGNDAPKLDVLTVNNMHNMEHYGNLVTYMRLKNIVPPSSEPAAQPQPKK